MIKSLSGGLPLTDRTTQRGANKFRSPLFYIFYFFKYMIKANPSPNGNGFAFILSGDPNGIRTHDTTVKGWCLNRLTMGPRRRSATLSETIYRLFLDLLAGSSFIPKNLATQSFSGTLALIACFAVGGFW